MSKEKIICEHCAEVFKSEINLEAHLFNNNYCKPIVAPLPIDKNQNTMNKFKTDFSENKLLLDIQEPKLPAGITALEYAARFHKHYEAIQHWKQRLSYSLSPELKAMLTDGQVIGEDEFSLQLQYLNYDEKTWINSHFHTESELHYIKRPYRKIAIPVQTNNQTSAFTIEDMTKWAQWLCDSNWGEKETWGKHDPPSFPTMKELLDVYLKQPPIAIPLPEQTNKVKEPERLFTLEQGIDIFMEGFNFCDTERRKNKVFIHPHTAIDKYFLETFGIDIKNNQPSNT